MTDGVSDVGRKEIDFGEEPQCLVTLEAKTLLNKYEFKKLLQEFKEYNKFTCIKRKENIWKEIKKQRSLENRVLFWLKSLADPRYGVDQIIEAIPETTLGFEKRNYVLEVFNTFNLDTEFGLRYTAKGLARFINQYKKLNNKIKSLRDKTLRKIIIGS